MLKPQKICVKNRSSIFLFYIQMQIIKRIDMSFLFRYSLRKIEGFEDNEIIISEGEDESLFRYRN